LQGEDERNEDNSENNSGTDHCSPRGVDEEWAGEGMDQHTRHRKSKMETLKPLAMINFSELSMAKEEPFSQQKKNLEGVRA
jgi:hypothetical protein